MKIEPLVSADWLQHNIGDVVVLDASYYLPAMGKDADVEFTKGHIPGAQRWNIDQIADASSGLKHMMPSAGQIADAAAKRGITSNTAVVVYDQLGMFSAARVWLALKSAGQSQVALLDGGLPCWTGELASGEARTVPAVEYGDPVAKMNTTDRFGVLSALNDDSACVVDARAADRFDGVASEPVAGLLGGHMPGALNVPYTRLLDSSNKFKSPAELKAVFKEHEVDLGKNIITSCGSGVTASVVTFALALLGVESVVYDGSWSEWGKPELNLPVTKS